METLIPHDGFEPYYAGRDGFAAKTRWQDKRPREQHAEEESEGRREDRAKKPAPSLF